MIFTEGNLNPLFRAPCKIFRRYLVCVGYMFLQFAI
jgi:hypothetical protein